MSAVDYYDVQSMIRDARTEILSEMRRELEDVRYLVQNYRDDLYALQREVEGLARTLASRTEHLV